MGQNKIESKLLISCTSNLRKLKTNRYVNWKRI